MKILIGIGLCLMVASPASAQLERVEELVGAPARTHRVGPGGTTTWLLRATNDRWFRSQTVQIEVGAPTTGWIGGLSPLGPDGPAHPLQEAWPRVLRLSLAPWEEQAVLVRLTAPVDAPPDAEGAVTVASGEDRHTFRAVVRTTPRIYFIAIDSLGRDHLRLDAQGTALLPEGAPLEAPALMPRCRAFVEQAADFPDARAHLPAATDMNHLAALTGCYPGTIGVQSVATYFLGWNRQGVPVGSPPRPWMLRTGVEGRPVETLFHWMRQLEGAPDTLGAMVTGKEWVAGFLADPEGPVQRRVGGTEVPGYVAAPGRYRVGDPPSDPDAATDADPPRWLQRAMGLTPTLFPDDAWVADAAVRLLWAEDPEVCYVLLAGCDDAFHVMGTVDRPEDWDDRGTAATGDDRHRRHPDAAREPVIDTVREADRQVGRILDTLQAKGVLESSYVVLLSDHGAVTHRPEPVDLSALLAEAGIDPEQVSVMGLSGMSMVFVADTVTDPIRRTALAQQVEQVLQETRIETEAGPICPFIALTREEMQGGVDDVAGRLAAGEALGGSELYSDWCTAQRIPPNALSPLGPRWRTDELGRVRWPEVLVFLTDGFQAAASGGNLGLPAQLTPSLVGGHGAPDTQHIVLALQGPGLAPGRHPGGRPADIWPTLYHLMVGPPPGNRFDGTPLTSALEHPR